MFDRRFLAEAAALIAAAVLCAAVANVVADRERKLAWAGDYPNARVIPQPIAGERAAALTPAVSASEPDLAPPESPLTTTVPPTTTSSQPAPALTTTAQPAPAKPATPTFSLADFPSTPDSPSEEISPDQAIALWQLKVPFLDARRSDVFRQGHIAGARSFPVWESDIDARVTAFYEEGHDQEKPVVVYCSGGACEDSHMLAQKLWGLGFNNVLIYTEGWPDWTRRGLPARQG
ncbi:MAG TPA: rhodanese-like domain-containing protein, partial [Thermoanaerobaculia bacterium]|nr:rhodanese-like domain-containing protein [Thermoanaerobaculia bacterium]